MVSGPFVGLIVHEGAHLGHLAIGVIRFERTLAHASHVSHLQPPRVVGMKLHVERVALAIGVARLGFEAAVGVERL